MENNKVVDINIEHNKRLNHNIAAVGEAILLIWWGVVIMIDPLTIGMGAIGTGLILLGVNVARYLKGIPTKINTTGIGVIALVWGGLDTVFDPSLEISFAMLLIIIGVVSIGSLMARQKIQTSCTDCT